MTIERSLTLAHSPDADDLVMWWPLTGMRRPDGSAFEGDRGRPALPTRGWTFAPIAADIHTLNERAVGKHDLDITAISAFTYPFVREHYRVTRCGGSFGDGYGPKVVVSAGSSLSSIADLQGASFAVPGDRTTAFLALRLLLGEDFAYTVVPFQDVASTVAAGGADAGLLIHEAQLTFGSAGLRLVADLGAWWKDRCGRPLPLGLNVIRRDLDDRFGPGATTEIAELLRASVRHARSEPAECRALLRELVADRPEWADDALVDRYLGMYVNEITEDMGEPGREALAALLHGAADLDLAPAPGELDLV